MFYLFSQPLIYEVQGRDAARYLQARLTNDIRSLGAGQSCEAAMLNDRGRIEGLFVVFSLHAERFLLAADGGAGQEVEAALRRFIVADRVTVGDRSGEFSLMHVSQAPERLDLQDGLAAPRRRIAPQGCDVLYRTQEISAVIAAMERSGLRRLSDEEWHERRFAEGLAAFPAELGANLLFVECAQLEDLAPQKGCYVGQEVVERTRALGKTARRVGRVTFAEGRGLKSGTRIRAADSDAPAGEVLSCYSSQSGERVNAFAILHRERAPQGARVLAGGVEGVVQDA